MVGTPHFGLLMTKENGITKTRKYESTKKTNSGETGFAGQVFPRKSAIG